MHLNLDQTVAAAGLAPAALDVEGEASRTVAPQPGVRRGGEQIPDVIEQPRVGGGIGADGFPCGALAWLGVS